VFCAACGRNLAGVAQLPTRAEWEARRPSPAAPRSDTPPPVAGVDAFLAAMRAAGDPGVVTLPESRPGFLGRVRHAHGWVVRPVARNPSDPSSGYTPGVFLSTDGRVHRLESTSRGWGQRGPQRYFDTVGPELEGAPQEDEDLLADLAAILRDRGAGAA
jgi:hypothetical protein